MKYTALATCSSLKITNAINMQFYCFASQYELKHIQDGSGKHPFPLSGGESKAGLEIGPSFGI